MTLEILLAAGFGGALLTWLLGKVSARLRNGFAVLLALAMLVGVCLMHGHSFDRLLPLGFMGLRLSLRMNMLSWLFAVLILGTGLLSVVFSLRYMRGRARLDYYYFTLLLINAAMLGTVVAGDLLTFFICWELVSWSTVLLISLKGTGKAISAGLKYMVMALAGSLAMLVAILSLYARFDTLSISRLAGLLQAAPLGYVLFVTVLMSAGFLVINALWPFHGWLPDAHAEAFSPFSSVLSGVLVRKGLYGLYLLVYVLLGMGLLQRLAWGSLSYLNVMAWIGAITVVFAAFRALVQDDSKRILAWSTVGQGGYMVLASSLATELGVAGGVFHFLNYCLLSALLFFVAGAVEHRTGGTRDLNALGGLMRRMPIAFTGALAGVMGVIGVPLTNGFVSKWIIYKSLLSEGRPFLAFAAFLGTWGTILYGYKFLHNIFLGRIPDRFAEVRRVPFTMGFPIALLSALVLAFGVLPGIPLSAVSAAGESMGFGSLELSVWGIATDAGTLNVVNLLAAIAAGVFAVWALWRGLGRSVRVDQDDSYAAGMAVPRQRYNFTADFYGPLRRIIRPWAGDAADALLAGLAMGTALVSNAFRKVYTGYVGSYVLYILLFLAALIFVQMTWSPWL